MNTKIFIFILFFNLFNAMDNNPKILSLKMLAAKTVANSYENIETELPKLHKDYIDLIKPVLPITKKNAWEIYVNYKERKSKCEQFLIEHYQYKSRICYFKTRKELDEFYRRTYKNEYNKDFFSKKIENDLKQQNIKINPCLINRIAKRCTEQLDSLRQKAFDEAFNWYPTVPTYIQKHNPVMQIIKKHDHFRFIMKAIIDSYFICIGVLAVVMLMPLIKN